MATEIEMMTGYLARTEISHRLGVSSERVNQIWKSGQLPYLVTPLGRLSRVEDVERFIEERRSKAVNSAA